MTDLMAALNEALADVAAAFDAAPADAGSIYAPPPDGEYQALIHKFEFLTGDWGVGLKVQYQITNDEKYAGKICGDMFGLRTDRIQWLKSFLSRLDVPVESEDFVFTEEIRPDSRTLVGLLDTPVLIKVQSKTLNPGTNQQKNVTNVYLQRKLGEPGSNSNGFTPHSDLGAQQGLDFQQQFTPVGRSAVDDDIPF